MIGCVHTSSPAKKEFLVESVRELPERAVNGAGVQLTLRMC